MTPPNRATTETSTYESSESRLGRCPTLALPASGCAPARLNCQYTGILPVLAPLPTPEKPHRAVPPRQPYFPKSLFLPLIAPPLQPLTADRRVTLRNLRRLLLTPSLPDIISSIRSGWRGSEKAGACRRGRPDSSVATTRPRALLHVASPVKKGPAVVDSRRAFQGGCPWQPFICGRRTEIRLLRARGSISIPTIILFLAAEPVLTRACRTARASARPRDEALRAEGRSALVRPRSGRRRIRRDRAAVPGATRPHGVFARAS
jgi:hypothetical protein